MTIARSARDLWSHISAAVGAPDHERNRLRRRGLFRSPAGRRVADHPTGSDRYKSRLVVKLLATIVAALVMMLGVLVGTAARADAWPNDARVALSGHIDCGGLDTASSISYRTTWGESGQASLARWTSVSRWTGPFTKRTVLKWLSIEVRTYDIALNNVPRGGGSITLAVTCAGALGGSSTFSANFRVERPRIGIGATRHVCRSAALGCWV
jgi:hypothetical protein